MRAAGASANGGDGTGWPPAFQLIHITSRR
jgi:hypothetical protein